MAGEMERDARLILRAEDRASRTFEQVAASVKKVRQEIVDQSRAATEGRGDIAALQRALDDLKASGDDLIRGQQLIGQFERQGEAVGKAEERLRSATKALADYQAKAGDNPTDSQSNQIEKRAASITRAEANLERAQARLAEIETRMERAGIATNNLDRQFDQMAATAVEAAQGIAAAKNAIEDYPLAVQRATDAAQEFAAAQALAGKDQSFLGAGEFAYIQSLDTAKAKLAELAQFEKLEEQSARAAAAAERQRRADQLVGIQEVLRGNEQLDAQFKELAASEARLKDLNAFRQVGIDAAESAVKVERYGASVQGAGNDFQSFAQQVRVAVGNTSSGLQDIGQAIQQIDASADALAKPGAKINELQASTGQLTIAIATLDRTARQIDGFRAMQNTVRSAEATFAEAQAEVLRLATAVGSADEPVEALERELNDAQRTLRRAGDEMQKVRNDAVKMADGLRRAGIDTDNLDAEMMRIQASANRAGVAFAGLNQKVRGRGGFLGLDSFQMTNLSYQINDVVSGLLMGQPPMQVFLQQGGQIVQLFDGLFGKIVKLLPVLGPLAVGLGAIAFSLFQTKRAADALRGWESVFALMGDSVGYSAQAFADAELRLRSLGLSADEAKNTLRTFISEGLNPEGLDTFVDSVSTVAGVIGQEVPEAAQQFADALTGGMDEVYALNDATGILTQTELDQIQTLFDNGQAREAQTMVAEAYRAKAQEIANKEKSEWKQATDGLSQAFADLNTTLGLADAASSIAGRAVNQLTALVNRLTQAAQGARSIMADLIATRAQFAAAGSTRFGLTGDYNKVLRENYIAAGLNPDGTPKAPTPPKRQNGSPVPTGPTREGTAAIREQTEALREARNETRKLTREQTAAEARRRALRSAVGNDAERRQQADLAAQQALVKFDDDAAKAAERAAKRNKSGADKAARAAETLANQRRSIEEQLTRDLDSLEARVDKTTTQSLQDRLDAVDKGFTAIFQKIAEFKRKGGTQIDGQSVAAYEATVRAQIGVLRNQEQMKFYEDAITATIKDRADKIKAVEDAMGRGDLTSGAATDAIGEIVSEFAPKIEKLASDAITFATSLRTAEVDPKLEAFVSRFQRITQENSNAQGNNLVKDFAQKVIEDEGRKLDAIIKQRDALVAAENTLVELGVRTRTEAQSNIEAAYSKTTPLIQEQALVLDQLLSQFVAKYPEMQVFYDTWQAKLQGIAATSQYVDARYTQLKGGIDGLISGNALAGIDAMAQAMARLALGQQGALETLGDLGIAFANFIADTIIGLGKLILQMLLLSAIEKVTGIPVGALLKFMNATGLHTGGIVGQERTFGRRVPEMAFAGAPRYHSGGIAGFAPDEFGAILKRNEEVLTETDPRHRFNLGKGGNDNTPDEPSMTRNILVMDPEELANAMAGPAGERMILTHIRRNATTVAQLTGGK